ncbi:MAG: Txe/YoeB family addiction module toxin [Opitutales bacterium]|nr:Txe/YoeB family addiction module toxin [Opitutales bacterium]NRA26511.1 Txe/YoeB family addiction module toxin [Opitutales bacterium]
MSDSSYTCVVQKQFREDLEAWVKLDRKTALKVLSIVEEVLRDPFSGRGKPEPLKYLPGNVWSRRITQEDRLVYRVYGQTVDFLQCKYHY